MMMMKINVLVDGYFLLDGCISMVIFFLLFNPTFLFNLTIRQLRMMDVPFGLLVKLKQMVGRVNDYVYYPPKSSLCT